MAKTIPTDKARQAHWGRPVLLVLIGALALAALVWIGLELYGETIDPPSQDLPSLSEDQ